MPHKGDPYAAVNLLLVETEFLIELVHASACIYQLLLAGVKGVTLGADFNLDVLLCGARLDDSSAGTLDCRRSIVGMDTLFHDVFTSFSFQSQYCSNRTAYIIIAQPLLKCNCFFLDFHQMIYS